MTASPDQPLSASLATALCGQRILVIEDEWIVAQSYVAILENLGVTASGPASTFADAIRVIEAEPIDAALVDMNLNGEMAYSVVDALNARGIAVVVVTGYDVVPEFENKVSAFLKKPIRAEALIKAFRGVTASRDASSATAASRGSPSAEGQ